ncbi:MAG TPA: DUF4395 domain-containing protein [Epsilonproteobacteria bacterium]|nr:DUF4395 domain-containing protein [Campylobacterota bacterium]
MSSHTISASCPISSRRVDANMVRVISFQVALFSVVLFFTQESIFAVILLFDFAMRTLRLSNLSPFHIMGKFILTGWGIAPKLCDESPKRFALYIGLSISLVLAVLFVAELTKIATFIAVILFVCALLETLFDFCIGCKIYYAIQLIKAMGKHDRDFK